MACLSQGRRTKNDEVSIHAAVRKQGILRMVVFADQIQEVAWMACIFIIIIITIKSMDFGSDRGIGRRAGSFVQSICVQYEENSP